ncbi:MAG TPA: 3-phosphoshikimate 1-carboxyvinyltransferase, partial [Candidatus Methanomethylophilaceae archaeon]|nr:3-phosphoshikimate 1-carboxyvinyltransferase [Candidatus Methanomethylophilaceae archaeon]
MKIEFQGGKISGRINPPPSKSHTHRAFFLSSMAKGRSTVRGALISEDTESTLKACESIGASVIYDVESVMIDGGNIHAPANKVDAKNSGTTMRLFAGICSLFPEESFITGDETLLLRPMEPLLDALEQMGVKCCSNNGYPPVTIKGPNLGGKVSVEGSKSSQYATSIIMCAPLIQNDTFLTITGKMISEPYIDITIDMMRQFGAKIEKISNTLKVSGGTGYSPCDYIVPGDPSSAAFGMVAGAIGGRVIVSGIDPEERGDAGIVSILEKAGVKVTRKDGDVIVESAGRIKPMDIDVGNVPDLFPILAVLLSTADGESRLYGAPQLKFKESDRLKSTVDMLNAIGADATATDDGC